MNKLLLFAIILVFGAVFLTKADEATPGMIRNTVNGIEVRIENAINSVSDHQPGQKGIVSSAVRGLGRLIKNVTVESGRYAANVASGAVNLVKHTARAGMETVVDSANRLRGTYLQQDSATPAQPKEAATLPNELHNANPTSVIEGDVKVEAGAAPNELTNVEVST